MNVYENNCNALYCVGDTHGEINTIPYMIKSHDLTDAAIVFCGDIGLGFEKIEYARQLLKPLDRLCKERNIQIYFVRGNHDDPAYFSEERIRYGNVRTVPDYSVIRMPEHNILCIGGAVSVDRKMRLDNMDFNARAYMKWHRGAKYEDVVNRVGTRCYWEDEKAVFNEAALTELKESGIQIDTVCTHTSPTFCKPLEKVNIQRLLDNDPELAHDIDEERQVMTDVFNRLVADGHPLRNWVYGHFHFHNTEYIDGVRFLLLDCVNYGRFDIADIR